MRYKTLLSLALTVIILIAIFLLLFSNRSTNITESPERIEVEGETVCLPHRDTSGPVTLECALGLQVGDKYYSIDTMLMASMEASELVKDTGNRVKVSGVYTPIEELSSNHWQKYNVEGIISVTSVEEL